jgi:glutaredoxin 3
MADKRKIEIFSAGCPACDETIQLVKSIACPSCDVQVLDMRQEDVASRAKEYGIKQVPAVVIDGKLSDCCTNSGVNAETLKANGVGVPLTRI